MNELRLVLLILFSFLLCELGFSQLSHYTLENAHSHNDYEHALPFYSAYARHFGSIEVDLWAMNDTLFVAHARNQVTPSSNCVKRQYASAG
jgi:alkaline phosphatase